MPLVDRYRAVSTPIEAFKLDEPAIDSLAKQNGLERVKSAFCLQIAKFAADLHVKDNLTPSDIDFIADQLTTDPNYKWLKLADIALLMKRIRMNKYGKLYQSMNAGTFFECLDKYCIERNAEIERMRAQEAQEMRQQGTTIKLPYHIDRDGKIVVDDEKPKHEAGKGKTTADKVAHMARVYASQGMDYKQAIEKALERIET